MHEHEPPQELPNAKRIKTEEQEPLYMQKKGHNLNGEVKKRPTQQAPTTGHSADVRKREPKAKGRVTKSQLQEKLEDMSDANYYFENGLRKIVPYYYKFSTFAKGRWVGKTVLEVFSTEFRDQTPDYYKAAIEDGRITVNSEIGECCRRVDHNDLFSHTLHRHEPPVTAEPIRVLQVWGARKAESGKSVGGVLAVHKPASMTIHPSGRYRHNCVLHILYKELGYQKLYPINRIDRLTSGVALFALDNNTAMKFQQRLLDGRVKKEYVARVLGEFPESEITCEEPILCISHKLGLNCVSPDGKKCTTIFKRLSYNGRTSVVQCIPITGRTHQIRVHLQFLGHPIANDPLYGGPAWRAIPGKGSGLIASASRELIVSSLIAQGFEEDQAGRQHDKDDQAEISKPASKRTFEPAPGCRECLQPKYEDPTPEQLCIWLHAKKYSSDEATIVKDESGAANNANSKMEEAPFAFESPSPAWADAEFTGDQEILESLENEAEKSHTL